jgi:hypothetical protein
MPDLIRHLRSFERAEERENEKRREGETDETRSRIGALRDDPE